jgi:hypothetical protein
MRTAVVGMLIVGHHPRMKYSSTPKADPNARKLRTPHPHSLPLTHLQCDSTAPSIQLPMHFAVLRRVQVRCGVERGKQGVHLLVAAVEPGAVVTHLKWQGNQKHSPFLVCSRAYRRQHSGTTMTRHGQGAGLSMLSCASTSPHTKRRSSRIKNAMLAFWSNSGPRYTEWRCTSIHHRCPPLHRVRA